MLKISCNLRPPRSARTQRAPQTHRCTTSLLFSLTVALATVTLGDEPREDREGASGRVLLSHAIPLRSGNTREWSDFPSVVGNPRLRLPFRTGGDPKRTASLRIWQRDVKEYWDVLLNGQKLGRLARDENAQYSHFDITPSQLRTDGDNVFEVRIANDRSSDDIELGDVQLFDRSTEDLLTESTIRVAVTSHDLDSSFAIPCRVTVTDLEGNLCPVGNRSSRTLAVRTGVVYTLSGRVDLKVPAGTYLVYASRGMEWSAARAEVSVTRDARADIDLNLRRVVPTEGWVACDTHVHTLTYSGHGDSSIEERMVTIAGEGIELPVATDHNVNIDYRPHIAAAGAGRFYTPVIGNEVTTRLGHFNVFPIEAGASPPDHTPNDWTQIFRNIQETPGVQAIILNHGRDLHSSFRPLGPANHIAIAGENVHGWQLEAGAMELINSAATQTNPYQLFHDWLGLLNRGHKITPVGCSDSHDVSRHFIGQGRTYIRVDDRHPGALSVSNAVDSFVAGKVSVSYGLFATLKINHRFESGDLVPAATDDHIVAQARVYGPEWASVERVRLFQNGQLIRTAIVPPADRNRPGLKLRYLWKIPKPTQDVHWVLIADGPGVTAPFWPMAKAYQPTSIEWAARSRAITGAVWYDANANGRRDSPFDVAKAIVARNEGDLASMLAELAKFDPPTQIQGASIVRSRGTPLLGTELERALDAATPSLQRAFAEYTRAWQMSVRAGETP